MRRYIDTAFMARLRYGAIRVETYKWREKGGCGWGRWQRSNGTVDDSDGKGHLWLACNIS